MFANFHNPFSPRPRRDPFVQEVEVREREGRSRTLERMLVVGWLLIGAKAAFTYWAYRRYGLPFHPGWLVWPSVAFGVLCTLLYLRRLRR